MLITITDKNIKAQNKECCEVDICYGSDVIGKIGFQAVDNAVEKIIPIIKKEEVFIDGKGVEAKMIARKIEDKIKRDVIFINQKD